VTTQPLFSPKFRAFASNGDPLSGGLLYSYAAGTSTPLPTYTTRAGDVANANPVVLDANGEANVWVTPGVLYKFALFDYNNVIQWTVDNVPSSSSDSSASSTSDPNALEPGGRLTLSTGVPVTTSDVTGASTVYYTPHKHNEVPLWDGSKWTTFTFSELSQAAADTSKSPAAVAVSSVYDLFVWNDSGTLRLSRGPAWTSPTSRGTSAGTTELQLIGTRYTNKWAISNGPATNRGLYVGTVVSNVSALFTDSASIRLVWNTYNRVLRYMRRYDNTNLWTYESASARQANGNTANQLNFVLGLELEPVEVEVMAQVEATSAAPVSIGIGIGIGSTSSFGYSEFADASSRTTVRARLLEQPPIGSRVLVWLESGNGTLPAFGDHVTWYSNGTFAGMFGKLMA
jgi:hypothetical protein